MSDLPRGTVAFLFTDIAGSTRLWQAYPAAMRAAYDRHDALLRTAISAQHGVVYKVIGDAFQAAFPTAREAVTAALEAQRGLQAESWSQLSLPEPLRVRMALHACAAAPDVDGDYRTPGLNRLGRLLAVTHGGQILLTGAALELARETLPAGTTIADLGVHRFPDLLEPEHVSQLVAVDLPSGFPPLKTLDARTHNLPFQPTPLVGRERETAEVVALLRRPEVRLLTLTGPGGTGKTRLGLQVAAEMLEDFPDGVFFVPLAAISDPDLVPAAIAEAIDVREAGSRPLRELLRDELANKQVLLLLDNLEQVTAVGSLLTKLLAGSAGLKVLVTSRIVLNLRAEREYPVPPLGLPRRKPPPTLEQMSQYEAVRLFVDLAQAAKPGFSVDNANAPAVAEICHRLDGLPLAIELAAARVRMLPPQALLARLQKRLPLLTGGAQDLPDRQRTLRQAIAWSHDLLNDDERILFRRLAVFTGGCTLEATDGVANPDGELDVFASLERLVAHSLVRQGEGVEGEPRFSMLETIREFGLEQIEEAGEAAETRRRYVGIVVRLAEDAEPQLTGQEQQRWLERLESEHDNIRSVLAGTVERDPEIALRIAGALWRFWAYRGHLTEGRSILDRLLKHPGVIPAAVLAKAFDAASGLAWTQGDLPAAQRHAEESLARYRRLGDPLGIANALQGLGVSYGDTNDAGAVAAFEEELLLRRKLGDLRGTGVALLNIGELVRDSGDTEPARAYYTEALAALQTAGDRTAAAWALSELGLLDLWAGNLTGGTKIAEALHIFRDLGHQYGASMALDRQAVLAIKIDQPSLAARLLGAAEALREPIGAALQTTDRSWYDQTVVAVRAALGDDAFAAAWEAGTCLALDDAIAEAVALVDGVRADKSGD